MSTSKVLVMKSAPLRIMALITSNGYQDRDEEYITTAALKRYVNEAWKGGTFRRQPLLYWHEDPEVNDVPIGDVFYAEMQGAFLIELAKERDDPFSKRIWDYVESSPDEHGVSHGFGHNEIAPRGNGRTFRQIDKVETSILPLRYAANPFTGVAL